MVKTSRFNFSQLLDFKKADYGDTLQAGQYPDDRITLQYRLPYGAAHEAKEWVYANHHVLRDVELPHMLLQGVWRTVALVTKPIDPDSEKEGQFLQWTIAKGLYTEIDWNSARREQGRETIGNNVDAGVTNGRSDNPADDFYVIFPYCDPDSINTMAHSLSPQTTAGDITVRGEVYEGPWHLISVSTKKEEDGTHSIVAHYSRSSYVLKGYSDSGGSSAKDSVYLWRIPKDEAQQIADEWREVKGVGSAASFSFSEEQGFVDMVLAAVASPGMEASATYNAHCDTQVQLYYYWGIDPTTVSSYTAGVAGSGISRQVEVNDRGDGLVNIQIRVTTVTYDPSKHEFQIDAASGLRGSKGIVEYGWNVTHARIQVMEQKAELAEANRVKQLQVDRLENCLFNYVYRCVLSVALSESFDLKDSNLGVGERTVYFYNFSEADVVTIRTALAAVGEMQESSIQVTKTEADTFSGVYTIKSLISRILRLYDPAIQPQGSGDLVLLGAKYEPSTTAPPTIGTHTPPNYIWGFNVKAFEQIIAGWSPVDVNVNWRPSGRFDYYQKIVKDDAKISSESVGKTGVQFYTTNRRQIIKTQTATSSSTLPMASITPDDANTIDRNVLFSVNTATGLIDWSLQEITWRIPDSWKTYKVIANTITNQRRSRVVARRTIPDGDGTKDQVLLYPEFRTIELKTERMYSTMLIEAGTATVGSGENVGKDVVYVGGRIDDNLFYMDRITTKISAYWQPDPKGTSGWHDVDVSEA